MGREELGNMHKYFTSVGHDLRSSLQELKRLGSSMIYFMAENSSPAFRGSRSPYAVGFSCSAVKVARVNRPGEELQLEKRCYAAAPTVGDRVYKRLMKKGKLSEKEVEATLKEKNLYRSAVYRK